jgi:hypothetical protein
MLEIIIPIDMNINLNETINIIKQKLEFLNKELNLNSKNLNKITIQNV